MKSCINDDSEIISIFCIFPPEIGIAIAALNGTEFF